MRAFAEQGSRIGFVDLDEARGRALAEELRPPAPASASRPATCATSDLRKRAFAALEGALGPDASWSTTPPATTGTAGRR